MAGKPHGLFAEQEIQSDIGSTVSIMNRCKSEVHVAVKYRDVNGRMTTSRWIRVPPKNQVKVIDRMVDTTMMWIGDSKDTAWTNDEANAPDLTVDGETYKAYVLTIPTDNQYTITLNCQ